MNQWNDLFGKAKDIANAATKKTGEVVEASKLKLQEASINSDIASSYEKIGSWHYRSKKMGVDFTEKIEKEILRVDGFLEALKELHEKMAEIKRVRKCANCGAVCPIESHFCSRCGMIIDNQTYSPAYDVEYREVNQDEDYSYDAEPEAEHTSEDEDHDTHTPPQE